MPVALFPALGGKFNPYRHFRHPEIGLRKLAPHGLRIEVIDTVYARIMIEPAMAHLARGLETAIAWAESQPPPSDAVTAPSPAAMYQRRLTSPSKSLALRAGERLNLAVKLKNSSPVAWDAFDRSGLMIGNHWLASNGAMMIWSDGRAPLTRRLAPGERAYMTLDIVAPHQAGDYLLEIDLVEEGICWFSDFALAPLQIPVQVRPRREESAQSDRSAPAAGTRMLSAVYRLADRLPLLTRPRRRNRHARTATACRWRKSASGRRFLRHHDRTVECIVPGLAQAGTQRLGNQGIMGAAIPPTIAMRTKPDQETFDHPHHVLRRIAQDRHGQCIALPGKLKHERGPGGVIGGRRHARCRSHRVRRSAEHRQQVPGQRSHLDTAVPRPQAAPERFAPYRRRTGLVGDVGAPSAQPVSLAGELPETDRPGSENDDGAVIAAMRAEPGDIGVRSQSDSAERIPAIEQAMLQILRTAAGQPQPGMAARDILQRQIGGTQGARHGFQNRCPRLLDIGRNIGRPGNAFAEQISGHIAQSRAAARRTAVDAQV